MRQFIILTYIFLSVLLSCSGGDYYTNSEVGFSFKVPDGCFLTYNGKVPNYYVRVLVKKPEELLDGKDQFFQIQNDINSGKPVNIPNIPSIFVRYIKIVGINAGIDFHRGYDVSDGIFAKRLFFVKNNYLVEISIQYEFDPPKSIDDESNIMHRFQKIQKDFFIQSGRDKVPESYTFFIQSIEDNINNKKGDYIIPLEITTLFEKFDKLIESIVFNK